jgi:hypothetical protein
VGSNDHGSTGERSHCLSMVSSPPTPMAGRYVMAKIMVLNRTPKDTAAFDNY